MKHLPFESIYRPDYEVVEERKGKLRLYPHTAQLPVLLRAIHNEFYTALPPRIARADHRATDFEKIVLKNATILFCNTINGARADELRFALIFDKHLVARPTIVQQITEEDPRGRSHRFRFYAGKDQFIEKYLCGRRVVFADHVLRRFSSRTDNFLGEDMSNFLMTFFDNALIAMPVGPGRAFVIEYSGSILALPFREQGDEYFVTTCLTVNEINSLEMEIPPHAFNVHYDLPFVRPVLRNWSPCEWMMKYYKRWASKALPEIPHGLGQKVRDFKWKRSAQFVVDITKKRGRDVGWKFGFMDNMPGPVTVEASPTQSISYHDEVENYYKSCPGYDWEWIMAERVEQGTYPPPRYPLR